MRNIYTKIKPANIILSKNYSINGKNININNMVDNNISVTVDNLSAIRKLSNLEKINTVNEYYESLFSQINLTSSLDYSKILGPTKSRDYLQYLKEKIKETEEMLTSYHFNIFPLRKRCYSNLEHVSYNNEILKIPKYNHSGITGRTSITEGFNFLTFKKEERKNLKSTKINHSLVEVDFKSCEPFFFLKSQGANIDNTDVYAWIANKYNIDIKDRAAIKRGILSMIYGANEYTISKLMKVSEEKIKKIKNDLGISNLKEEMENEFNENGFVLNYYGRPITSNNNLVNYWIQSSAVDFCSLAFLNFYTTQDVKPCYFIHDSMTFEVENSRIKDITNINSIKEPLSNIEIPVEFNVLG